MSEKIVRVGVGVFIVKDNKILLGKRKNAHEEGTWSLPGGHLEFNETIEECAIREVKEETNLEVSNPKIITLTQDKFEKEEKHYITVFTQVTYEGGEVKNKEPHKCEKWEWFEWEKLPENLFLALKNFKEKGNNPFKTQLL